MHTLTHFDSNWVCEVLSIWLKKMWWDWDSVLMYTRNEWFCYIAFSWAKCLVTLLNKRELLSSSQALLFCMMFSGGEHKVNWASLCTNHSLCILDWDAYRQEKKSELTWAHYHQKAVIMHVCRSMKTTLIGSSSLLFLWEKLNVKLMSIISLLARTFFFSVRFYA